MPSWPEVFLNIIAKLSQPKSALKIGIRSARFSLPEFSEAPCSLHKILKKIFSPLSSDPDCFPNRLCRSGLLLEYWASFTSITFACQFPLSFVWNFVCTAYAACFFWECIGYLLTQIISFLRKTKKLVYSFNGCIFLNRSHSCCSCLSGWLIDGTLAYHLETLQFSWIWSRRSMA